jgi:hypothetical protein
VKDRRVTLWISLIGHLLKCRTEQLLFESIWQDTSWSAKQKLLFESIWSDISWSARELTVWVNLIRYLLNCKKKELLFESIWSNVSWIARQKGYFLSQLALRNQSSKTVTCNFMKKSTFWGITPCSPLNVNRIFRGTLRLHVQIVLSSGFNAAQSTESQPTFRRNMSVDFQRATRRYIQYDGLFISTVVGTSNHTCVCMWLNVISYLKVCDDGILIKLLYFI